MIKTCQSIEAVLPREVERAAERLACLLVDTDEFQRFARAGFALRRDSEASDILRQVDGAGSRRELSRRLESLPVMVAYRGAEQATQALFSAADAAISAAAGLPFAENAAASGGT